MLQAGLALCSAIGLYTPLGFGATMGQVVPDSVLVQWWALTHVAQVSWVRESPSALMELLLIHDELSTSDPEMKAALFLVSSRPAGEPNKSGKAQRAAEWPSLELLEGKMFWKHYFSVFFFF